MELTAKIFENYFRLIKIGLYFWLLENVSRNIKKSILKYCAFIKIYLYILTDKQVPSNLIYIPSCLFISSHYDVYWLLSNAALSGATSECPFHNRNIFIHQVLANCLQQYCGFETWRPLITFLIENRLSEKFNCRFHSKIPWNFSSQIICLPVWSSETERLKGE
jgi:hypothetical protein